MGNKKFQSCIDACIEYAAERNRCASECLNAAEIQTLPLTCAAICLIAIETLIMSLFEDFSSTAFFEINYLQGYRLNTIN